MTPYPEPRSRKQTRAALLSHLLTAGDCFRGELVSKLELTEASISRIVSELKTEGLVIEYARRPAPYPGGPTNVVALDRAIHVAAIELANGRISVGVGTLAGELMFSHRQNLSNSLTAEEVDLLVREAIGKLSAWTRQQKMEVRQIAISLPGFGLSGELNAIVRTDAKRLTAIVSAHFENVPCSVTNSVQAQAALHGFGIHSTSENADHLFVFVGHGVGAVHVGNMARGIENRPVELGHIVMDPAGPWCRCGHQGCVEAYVALPALAEVFGLPEEALLVAGDQGLEAIQFTDLQTARVDDMLFRLGIAIGNTLNVSPVQKIVMAGWPSLIPSAHREHLLEGIDRSVLGGVKSRNVALTFIAPSIGSDPLPTLCYAAYGFVQSGAIAAPQTSGTEPPARSRTKKAERPSA